MAVEEHELSVSDYISIIKRRWRVIAITSFLVMIAVTFLAFNLPSVYESSGQITIESASISTNLIRQGSNEDTTAKYVDERLDKVKRKILSRENLLNINEKYSLYPELKDPAAIEKPMAKSIKILPNTKTTDGSQWGQRVTVGFDVIFNYSEPDKTHKVATELVSQLMEENAKDRTVRATETTSFLTDELNKLKVQLELVENKVATYKKAHSNSLPEHQEMHMGILDQLRTSIKDLDRDYKSTQEELRYLDVEFTTTNATLKNTGSDGNAIVISDLDKARAELDRGLVLYKDTHPTIRALKRKVALLEKNDQLPVGSKPKRTNVAAELALAKINTQLQAARVRLDSIAVQKRSMLAQMSKLQGQIVKIPEVERGLFTLLRDYENAKLKYEDVKSKQINAKIAENLELGNKAERFILLRAPEFPEYRISPKRKNILAIGLLAALGLGLALAALLELLDKRVRGLAAVTSIIHMKPIAVIPYIKTKVELNKEKNLIKYASMFASVLILLLLIIASIHFFVMPLNLLIAKFA